MKLNKPEKRSDIRMTMSTKWRFLSGGSENLTWEEKHKRNKRKKRKMTSLTASDTIDQLSVYELKKLNKQKQLERALEIEQKIYSEIYAKSKEEESMVGGTLVNSVELNPQYETHQPPLRQHPQGLKSPTLAEIERAQMQSMKNFSIIPHQTKNDGSLTPTAEMEQLANDPRIQDPLYYTPRDQGASPDEVIADPFDDIPKLKFRGLSGLLDTNISPRRAVNVPKFKSLHPIHNIVITRDFPPELIVDSYVEDNSYQDYRKRLAQDESTENTAYYGAWYLPPDEWKKYKTMGQQICEKSKKKFQPKQPLRKPHVKKRGGPKLIKQPKSRKVLSNDIGPLPAEKKELISKLHSSKKFKEYLVKTHSEIPEWLKNIKVSQDVLKKSKIAVQENTAIPQALLKVDYAQSSKQKRQTAANVTGKELHDLEESVLEKNKNDIQYIQKFMAKLPPKGKGYRKRKASKKPRYLRKMSTDEYAEIDPENIPRQSIPLSTMIKLTSERRKKLRDEMQKNKVQASTTLVTKGNY
mmetsp:Transcript_10236/g.14986  ORF Transcript_10236/g.14986 Transcript_10236/m.14986 type:complete len:524 (+) Transcript_10236:150-1721(+)